MTYEQFLKEIELYYGPYTKKKKGKDGKDIIINEKVRKIVLSYLKNDIKENMLDTLRRYIFYSHPLNYGPPGIAAIEKAIDKAIENKRGPDVRIQHVQNKYIPPVYDGPISKDEREEVDKFLAKGGISGMLKKNVNKSEEWKK